LHDRLIHLCALRSIPRNYKKTSHFIVCLYIVFSNGKFLMTFVFDRPLKMQKYAETYIVMCVFN